MYLEESSYIRLVKLFSEWQIKIELFFHIIRQTCPQKSSTECSNLMNLGSEMNWNFTRDTQFGFLNKCNCILFSRESSRHVFLTKYYSVDQSQGIELCKICRP